MYSGNALHGRFVRNSLEQQTEKTGSATTEIPLLFPLLADPFTISLP